MMLAIVATAERSLDFAGLLLDISKLLSMVPAQQRAATAEAPRRPSGAGGGRGVSRKAWFSVATCIALFKAEVERKLPPGLITSSPIRRFVSSDRPSDLKPGVVRASRLDPTCRRSCRELQRR